MLDDTTINDMRDHAAAVVAAYVGGRSVDREATELADCVLRLLDERAVLLRIARAVAAERDAVQAMADASDAPHGPLATVAQQRYIKAVGETAKALRASAAGAWFAKRER